MLLNPVHLSPTPFSQLFCWTGRRSFSWLKPDHPAFAQNPSMASHLHGMAPATVRAVSLQDPCLDHSSQGISRAPSSTLVLWLQVNCIRGLLDCHAQGTVCSPHYPVCRNHCHRHHHAGFIATGWLPVLLTHLSRALGTMPGTREGPGKSFVGGE